MKQFFRTLHAVCLITVAGLSLVNAESGLSWRVFNQDQNTWIYQPKGLMLFSTLSRTVKPLAIDAVRPVDTLTDCILYEGYLWVSCNAGLYQVDAVSQSIERIPLPESDSTAFGKIAQDADYLWLGTNDKLLRFDKLGREWFTFDLPRKVDRMVGLWSNGDEVFCLGDNVLYRFTTATEKWNSYPLDKPLSVSAIFYPGTSTFKVLDGSAIMLYQPESFAWVKTDMGGVPQSVFDEDSVLFVSDGKEVKKISCESGMTKTINIPNPGMITSIAKLSDTLVLTTDKRIGKYSISKETMNYTEYDAGAPVKNVEKFIQLPSHYIIVAPDNITTYEKDTRAWQHVSRAGFQQKVRAFTWNEEEFAIRYAPGYQSTLSGSIQSGVTFDWDGYDYDTTYKFRSTLQDTGDGQLIPVLRRDTLVDSVELIRLGRPNFLGNVNFHTSDKNDRIADVFLNNTSQITAPSKGIYYRGNRDDRLNSIRVGTTSSEQITSPLLPEVSMEGASAILESKSRLTTKDRKIVRVAGGSGFRTTKTVTQIVPYRADGKYKFSASGAVDTADTVSKKTADTLRFVKESCKVIVDGEELAASMYNFYYSIGELHFNTMAPIDPGSIIVVEYKVQTIPEGQITDIELVPTHHFGKMHFGALTYSPKDWISAQIGYTGLDHDSLSSLVNVAVPLELRNAEKKMMLLLRPELLYNVNNGSVAAGAELKSRLGEKTGIVFNTMFADSAFESTDELSRGYGTKKGEYDVTVTHDIRQELPLSYYQHQRIGEDGVENRYAFTAGARFKGLPFMEMNLSRTMIDKAENKEGSVTTVDSLFHVKDRLKIRLYETSAAFLQKLTGFYKISYDLTHAENQTEAHHSDKRDAGRLSTFSFLLSPVQRIMLSGEVFYRGSMNLDSMPSSDIRPSFNLQMLDAPRGVDLTAINAFKVSNYYREKFSTDTIERSVSIVLKPGLWYAPLGWFSPRAKLTNNVQCRFASANPNPAQLLSGLHAKEGSLFSRELGVNIFPFDGLLFINTNEWAEADTQKNFNTLNKLQYNYNASNSIIAEWNYFSNSSKHTGNLSYEKLWTPWLRTNMSAVSELFHDTTGTNASAGPKLLVIFNVDNFSIIRTLSNTHDVDFKWKRHNGKTTTAPDISYTFGLRLKLKPNIELQVNNTTFKFNKGIFSDFENSTILLAYF